MSRYGWLLRILLGGAAPLFPQWGSAQDASQPAAALPDDERPLIEKVDFVGVQSLALPEIRAAIVTEPTRCRGALLLKPFCAFWDWSAIVDHHYLDRPELQRDELRLQVLYFRRGYRQTSVSSEVVPSDKGVEVVFNIVEGSPTLVESLVVRQSEELLTERQIRRALLPAPGEPLDLIRLEAAMFELESRLGQQGYLDAVLEDDIAVTENGERQARVELRIDPGPRSTLAEIEISGNEQVDDRIIAEAVRLRMGRVLRSTDILLSQRSLYESNLFHEARVQLAPQDDSAKTLAITVREAPPRSARVGGGFNTIEVFQVEARFTHYNWNGRARRLDLQGSMGNLLAGGLNGKSIFKDVLPESLPEAERSVFLRPTWQTSAEVMQPGFLSADNRIGLGVFAHRRSLPGIVVDQGYGANLSVTRRFGFRSPASLEYRFESTAVEAGDLYFCAYFGVCDPPSIGVLRGRHRISPIGFTYFTDQSDDPLSPKDGYRARLDLEHASALTLSDFRYNRMSAEATGYLPIGLLRRRVLSGKVRVGWVGPLAGTAEALGVEAQGLALLHPRRRFFAGGARSVRGFGENQLGPRVLTVDPALLTGDGDCTLAQVVDGSCDPNQFPVGSFVPRPLGGNAVIEGSVEYRFPFFGPLLGAAFVDAAVVSSKLAELIAEGVGAVTPGVGIRYQSAVVPIRVDLGFRPALTESLPVLTEIIDERGQRRLVRLTQPRFYDPVGEAEGSFLGRLFARLRLHVWIGEAY